MKAMLIWNEHPTEIVAGVHARRVAVELRRLGHTVRLFKIPAKHTIYGQLRDKSKPVRQRLIEMARQNMSSVSIAKNFAKEFEIPVFNFHASESYRLGQSTKRKPHEFRIDRKRSFTYRKDMKELEVANVGKNAFIVEMPARYHELPDAGLSKIEIQEIMKEGGKLLSGSELKDLEKLNLLEQLGAHYHSKGAKIGGRKNQKYLHPIITQKLTEEIHKQLTRRRK